MSSWGQGVADIEQLLREGQLQSVLGTSVDGEAGIRRARTILASAESLLATDHASAFVLAYDAARQACTVLLAQQALRATVSGGHVAVERAVRAQFGSAFQPYGLLRRRRNDVEYPAHPEETVDLIEAEDAVDSAGRIIDAAEKLLPHLTRFAA